METDPGQSGKWPLKRRQRERDTLQNTEALSHTHHGESNGKVRTQLVVGPRSGGTDRILVHATTVDQVAAKVRCGGVGVDVEKLLKVLLDEFRPLTIGY